MLHVMRKCGKVWQNEDQWITIMKLQKSLCRKKICCILHRPFQTPWGNFLGFGFFRLAWAVPLEKCAMLQLSTPYRSGLAFFLAKHTNFQIYWVHIFFQFGFRIVVRVPENPDNDFHLNVITSVRSPISYSLNIAFSIPNFGPLGQNFLFRFFPLVWVVPL
jgi:hypothetical protein